jgi:hypothetical protein
MRNIELTTPVQLPKGTVEIIDPNTCLKCIKTCDELEEFTSIIYELNFANQHYRKLCRIGAPDILIYKTYQKLQNAVWRLSDRFPASITERRCSHDDHKRNVHRPGDIF